MNIPKQSVSTPGAADAFIPLCVPELRGNEWKYVKDCLDTNWVSTAGAYVEKFERLVADTIGTRHAIAAVNGTAALHIALLVAGIEHDDEVIVSTLTFIAPANAIRYAGGWPVFVDAEPDYWEMDCNKLEDFLCNGCEVRDGILRNRTTGRRVRAIMPVHILGHPVDLNPIIELAEKYDLKVIEDATESLGARYRGERVGHIGDIACFSFNGNKLLTTGGGGMIVTDNDDWARRARYLTTQAKDDEIEYVHESVGYNYRLTNIQAALGVAQMEQLESYISAKLSIAKRYENELGSIPGIQTMRQADWAESVFWMYTVLIDEEQFGASSRELMTYLSRAGIQTRPLWQPIHRSPAHFGAFSTDCSVAEHLNRCALSLPCSVGLREESHSRVIETILSMADNRTTAASL